MDRLVITDGQRTINLMSLDGSTVTQLKRSSWFKNIGLDLKTPIELRFRIQIKHNINEAFSSEKLRQIYRDLQTLQELLWIANEFGKYRLGRAVYLELTTQLDTTLYYCHILGSPGLSDPSSIFSASENDFIEPFEIRLTVSPLWIYSNTVNYAQVDTTVATPGPMTYTLSTDPEIIPSPTIMKIKAEVQGADNDKPLFLVVASGNPNQLTIADIATGTSGTSSSQVSARNGSVWEMSIAAGATQTFQTFVSSWSDFNADHARIFISIEAFEKVFVQAVSERKLTSSFIVEDLGPRVVVPDIRGFPLVYDLGVVPARRYANDTTFVRFNVRVNNPGTSAVTVRIDWVTGVGQGPSTISEIGTNAIAQLPSSYIYSFPQGVKDGFDILVDPGMMKRTSQGGLTDDNDRPYAGVYYSSGRSTGTTNWENGPLLKTVDPFLTNSNTIKIGWLQTGIGGNWLPWTGSVANIIANVIRRPASLSPFRESRQ